MSAATCEELLSAAASDPFTVTRLLSDSAKSAFPAAKDVLNPVLRTEPCCPSPTGPPRTARTMRSCKQDSCPRGEFQPLVLVISLTNCSACDVRTVTHVGNLRRSGELMISVVVCLPVLHEYHPYATFSMFFAKISLCRKVKFLASAF